MCRQPTHGGVLSDCGVIYLVLNRPIFMQMCMLSMMSLRKSGYEGPVAVATNLSSNLWSHSVPLWRHSLLPRFNLIQIDDTNRGSSQELSKVHKTRLNRITPFQKSLYLDADTIICRSINPIWRIVRGRPLAMALDRAPTIAAVRKMAPKWGNAADWDETVAECGLDHPHFNSGVIYWESAPQIHELFENWESEFKRFQSTDQAPLLRAMHRTQSDPIYLPSVYNYQSQGSTGSSTVVRHFVGLGADEAVDEMLAALVALCERHSLNNSARKSRLFSRTRVSATAELISADPESEQILPMQRSRL